MMWMHHVGQDARECGVPIVQIAPEDMKLVEEGSWVSIDGAKGIVAIGG